MSSSDHAGVVFFDVDGTLVPGASSSVFLAGFLGHRDELTRAEDSYASGDLDNRQVSELDAKGWGVSGGSWPGVRRLARHLAALPKRPDSSAITT
ncbi:hypothetical protein ACGFW5_06645, partial [Streptomyces sp. NPDC048416]